MHLICNSFVAFELIDQLFKPAWISTLATLNILNALSNYQVTGEQAYKQTNLQSSTDEIMKLSNIQRMIEKLTLSDFCSLSPTYQITIVII